MKAVLLCLLLLAAASPSWAVDPPTFLYKWGSSGSGPGQFNNPSGFCIAPNGHVYVADLLNNRVQEFTSTGVFVRFIGPPPDGYADPMDVAVDLTGRIYVAEYAHARIAVFDAAGNYTTAFSVYPGSGSVVSLAIDQTGQILYALLGTGEIQKYDMAGNELIRWMATGSGHEQGFSVDNAGQVVIGTGAHCTVRTFTSGGVLVNEWGAISGGLPGQCDNFYPVGLDASGQVYVAGTSPRVQLFSPSGSFIVQWGSGGAGDGQFGGAMPDLAVDADNNVYVLDATLNRIQVFGYAPTPTTRRTWGALKMLYR